MYFSTLCAQHVTAMIKPKLYYKQNDLSYLIVTLHNFVISFSLFFVIVVGIVADVLKTQLSDGGDVGRDLVAAFVHHVLAGLKEEEQNKIFISSFMDCAR